jgi:hypothetical protein
LGVAIGVFMDATKRVVLILADISGYTRFMLANATALIHAQMVITKLLEEIIREAEIPLEVKEVEGDAVFIYAIKPDDEATWDETRRVIGRKLFSFFDAFARGIVVGSEFALCSCPSCQNIDQLKLKVVVHSGEAVFHKVGRFSDLSGIDVILAHRLLKNSIPSAEYVLMTESAYRDLELQTHAEVSEGVEHYEGFGEIRTYTYPIEGVTAPTAEAIGRLYEDRGRAFATGLRMLAKGYIGQFQILLDTRAARRYSNIGDLSVSPLARAAMALRVVLLAPLMVPFGAGIQIYRALTRSTLSERRRRA